VTLSPAFDGTAAFHGILGGLLIGLAASLMLLGAGRIAGVSGIAARATGIADEGMSRPSALAFLVGLPLGAGLILRGGWAEPAALPYWPTLVGAGLLVGFGTRLGSGCTSGHGVCGLSRLSPRSIVATLTFIAAGVATVSGLRLLGGAA
jgi:uncharacterized membrane protein YedE/YeeE